MPRVNLIQKRRDTAANWTSTNPILASGEEGFETDSLKSKIGDGTTAWTSLGYAYPGVDLISNQTISGIKTFSSSPIIPTPTTSLQAATKGYVDASATMGTQRFVVAPFGDTRPADYTCTNNTANQVEINAAITAANALPDGGIVDILDGVFYIGGAVIPKNNVWIRGAGMYQTKFKATSALTTGIIDNKSATSAATPYVNGIISDLELDGSGMDSTRELKGFNSADLNNCKVMRVYCHDTTATGLGADDFYGSTLTECIVVNCGYMNKRTITAASWSANVFNYTTSAPHGYSIGSQIIVTGMTPSRYNGKYKVSSVPTSTTFTFDGTNNTGSLTLTVDPGTATVFGNTSDALIGHNGVGIASGDNYSEANIITNNVCIGNQNNNFLIEADNSNSGLNSSYIFSNNISVNAGQVGFQNTGTLNTQFIGNYDYGSPIGAQAAVVNQNRTITAASWTGGVTTYTNSVAHSYAVGMSVTVTGMTPAAYNGVYYVTSTPSTTTWTAALASDPGTASVFGSSSRVAHNTDSFIVQNNIFSHNVLYGIRINSLSDGYTVSGNTVKYCYNYGIYTAAGRGSITDNKVYGNGRDGIDIETGSGSYNGISKLTVTENHVYNNSRLITNYDGIEVQSSSTAAAIEGLDISHNQIYDTQQTPTQRYGVILRTGGTLSNISVKDNNLSGNLLSPLLIQNTSDSISVVNNVGVNPQQKLEMGNITGTVTFDTSVANYFTGTLTGNITAVMPVNAVKGTTMVWVLTQDATGSRTITMPANAAAAGTGVGLVLSTTPSVIDVVSWVYDGTKWRELSRELATTKITSREGIVSVAPATSNVIAIAVTQQDTTNNPDSVVITSTAGGNGFKLNQNAALAANKYGLFIDTSTAQTSSALARIRSSSASSTQPLLQLDNSGSGNTIAALTGNNVFGGSMSVGKTTAPATVLDVAGTITGTGLTIDTNTVFVDSTNHRLGIGILLPLAPVHISNAGTEQLRMQSSGSQAWMSFYHGTTRTGLIGNGTNGDIFGGAAADSINIRAENKLHLGAGGNNLALTVDTTKVGIGTTSPNSLLHVNGPIATAVVAKTAAYTATATDSTLTGDATTATFALTLPTAVGITGRQYTLKKIDASANAVTVATTSSQTIDGSTTYSLATRWKYVTVQSDGANWLIIANN